MLKIQNNLTTINYEPRYGIKPKYLVYHYTGNDGDTAYNNTQYFKSVNRNSSAHYFVDENSIWCCVDPKDTAWAVGSKTYLHNYCRNNNSISIEMCSRKDSKGNYYIKDETYKNSIELGKYIMNKYNITISNVLRHYDVNMKLCPLPLIDNNLWEMFKMQLIYNDTYCNINGEKVKSIMKDNENYVRLRSIADLLDFDVDYNPNTKEIIMERKK